jgi:transposase
MRSSLCDGLRRGIYRAVVHVPPPMVIRVRETLSRRRHFVRLETAQVNAVKRLLRGAGLGHHSRSLSTEVGWSKLCGALAGYGELREYIELHRTLWRCARTQRVTLEAVLTAQLAAPTFGPDLRRLQTIPGVGPIVAAARDVRKRRSAHGMPVTSFSCVVRAIRSGCVRRPRAGLNATPTIVGVSMVSPATVRGRACEPSGSAAGRPPS